jgi:hypothetical protein
VGAVTGLVAVALQEIVDFSLQMPGNAALFVILAALASRRVAQVESFASPHKKRQRSG